ncbi:MAG: SulP family inorganic anion transporter [Acidimicrobiia bacterium]
MSELRSALPAWLRDYDRRRLATDVIAGATLSAVAIPEVLGYTSIAKMPLVTGLYTIIFPTILFALLGSSKLLVVGADSATAALFAAGAIGIAGLTPGSSEWVAYAGLTALMCGVFLVVARVLKLGFLGDFLSASVLIGFLTGVGIQVLTGQLPEMLGVAKGTGTWFQQQWHLLTSLGDIQWATLGFAIATIVIILGFERFLPRVPGAIVAVVGLIVVSTLTDASTHGVAVVGSVPKGFPPIGFPSGLTLSDIGAVTGIAISCVVLIIAQSAATSRSFAMKHGDKADINRDLVGLAGANFAAGLTGTFVVNGSPTKTEILDEQKGRTQVANLTMAGIALLFTVFFTSVLKNMPSSVLAAIVFLIGVNLVDVTGLRRILARRPSEFVIAGLTAITVFAIGVEQGIILAVVISILEIVRRQYKPAAFVVGETGDEEPTYATAAPGQQSEPGLIVFRYDAELFYANANRFVDDVEALVENAPDPVRWVVLDAGALDDVDYSAGLSLGALADYLAAKHITVALARADTQLLHTLDLYGLRAKFPDERAYGNLQDAIDAFRSSPGRS